VTPTQLESRGYVSDLAAYRRDLREYLGSLDWAEDWRVPATSSADGLARDARALAKIYDAGWNRYGWPESAGGFGGTELHRAVYYDEIAAARLHIPAQHFTLETLGPALLAFAPELAAEYLSGYLSGQHWFGQCFSEPESGSDLATLRCRATEHDDHLVLTGQKIWTSQGPTAAKFLVLARTGTPESRHRGLTTLLVDADAPGVVVRPIALASGREEIAEIFFEDVHVPRDRLVGGIGQGWAVAMHLMQWERGMYGYAVLADSIARLTILRDHLLATGAGTRFQERFTEVYLAVVQAQARCAVTVRALAAGRTVGANSSVDKLLFSHAEKDLLDFAMDVHAESLLVGGDDVLRAEWWYSRTATLMGGTAQIQRGIVADHLLGLQK